MDNTNEQEKQIKELEERANNYALLDAKDGFFITTAYPGQIISDYVVEGGVTTKTLLAANLPFFIARHPCEVL